jgi:type III restriction enzyme
MELKSYQQKVIADFTEYLSCLQLHKRTDIAFKEYWQNKIGPYNPLTGEGMEPYKNNVPEVPHVCIKVPTAGGKTFIACNALQSIFEAFDDGIPKLVVWLVPWSNLLDQTVRSFSDPNHPYRQKLNSLFNNRVEVYEKSDLLLGSNFSPSVVHEQLSILILNFASLRAKKREDRKVFQENSQLAPFVLKYKDKSHLLEDTDETALINVIRSYNPVIVVDESHNAESDLSVDMLKTLSPSFILDLTATPKSNSNIISIVPAIELKKEHMVKLPVIVYNHRDKTEVIESALHLQRKLEQVACMEENMSGHYIRPIVLFQAQTRNKEDNTTFEKVKEILIKIGIPSEQIKIKTANKDELKDVVLSSKDCPVRYIITVNALKEGWDCPFAYILASLADRSSAVDVEQILGRVLRQPYVMKHSNDMLNMSFVLTASAKFNETLQNIVSGLQASGFSEKDYRQHDADSKEESLSGSNPPDLAGQEQEIEFERISFGQEDPGAAVNFVNRITGIALDQNRMMEAEIAASSGSTIEEKIFQEMGNKVKIYRLADMFAGIATKLQLPQFFLSTKSGEIFESGKVLLNQEVLLKSFRLNAQAAEIDFQRISSDLYKIDLENTRSDQYTPKFIKIEDREMKDPIIQYILGKPREKQIRDISFQLVKAIGEMNPVPDQELISFVERILSPLTNEQVQDILIRKHTYAGKIKEKIRELMDGHAEKEFNNLIHVKKIFCEGAWKFPKSIIPGAVGPSISSSLYEKEGSMNNFEVKVVTDLSSLSNILFWHRNLSRGKGFSINGFKSNHYPDFILLTKSGKIVVVETKGDDRDNSDSAGKCRLGNIWADKAGPDFHYFMVFEKNAVEGSFTVDKARDLISGI